jgi:hypothetical protein
LRIAGLPYQTSLDLSFEKSAEWAAAVLATEERLRTERESICLALETQIGQVGTDDPGRQHMINIRRDLFNGRRPRPASLAGAESLLRDSGSARIKDWISEQDELTGQVAGGKQILAGELADKRTMLRALADNAELRSAILLQSTVLDGQMGHYVRADKGLDKAARRIERSLLQFIYRASCKTSPFSTLASIGLGRFVDDPGAPLLPDRISVAKRGRIQLNMAALGRLSRLILASKQLRSDLMLKMTPGWSLTEEQLRYLRRRVVAMKDTDSAVTMDSVHEDLFFLASGQALGAVIELLPAGHERDFRDLAASLAAGKAEDEGDRYLGHLLRLGMLVVPALQVDINARDPLLDYASGVRSVNGPWSAELAGRLEAAAALVNEYADAALDRRRAILKGLRALVVEIFQGFDQPELAPRTLLYEDCFVESHGLLFGEAQWDRVAVADLERLATVLPAFDGSLPRRLLAKSYLRARFGQGGICDDVQGFAHDFQRDLLQPYSQRVGMWRTVGEDNRLVRTETGMNQPELRALDTARQAAADLVGTAWADPAAEEIQLGDEFVERVISELPPLSDPVGSWSFVAQLAAGDGADRPSRLIVNQIYSGMGLLFSRFGHGLKGPDGVPAQHMLAEQLAAVTPPGVVLAELRGGYDMTNLNLHPRVTPYEIVCAGEISKRPESEQISIEDLSVVDDVDQGRVKLVSRRLGVEVVPVYLGFLLPFALPEVQQVLLCFAPQGMAAVDLWTGTGKQSPADQVSRRPRVNFGSVVLQRREWSIPAESFPQRAPDDDDSAYFLRVNRWRTTHGMPRWVFAKAEMDMSRPGAAPPEDAAMEREMGTAGRFERKPLAVDFDGWFSVMLLENLQRGANSRLKIVEALPGPAELWARDASGYRYVTELVIELYKAGGGS